MSVVCLKMFTVERQASSGKCKDYLDTGKTSGYISSNPADPLGDTGSAECPWLISALPGQTVNLTLIDFQPHPSQQTCRPLGFVKDLHSGQEVIMCKSDKRKQHLYLSTGTEVEIQFGDMTDATNIDSSFVIYYEGMS